MEMNQAGKERLQPVIVSYNYDANKKRMKMETRTEISSSFPERAFSRCRSEQYASIGCNLFLHLMHQPVGKRRWGSSGAPPEHLLAQQMQQTSRRNLHRLCGSYVSEAHPETVVFVMISTKFNKRKKKSVFFLKANLKRKGIYSTMLVDDEPFRTHHQVYWTNYSRANYFGFL